MYNVYKKRVIAHWAFLWCLSCVLWLLLLSQQQGLQSHNRYLFLFDDLLIIAKPSGRNRYVHVLFNDWYNMDSSGHLLGKTDFWGLL